ncbi:hypothetical protein [Streptomyces sp. NBC_00859]|uniref:hypothetical protein n=1 Tax=Streptomyces sp. NBC_00859 TaxID=2903682 RepID=UPI003869ED0D|nr:hypothetical protein OG584_02165 [Streptomyces sp. NBC_00859]
MKCNGKIGVALVGGYLLGRTKKAKLAIGLGMFLAGKKLSLDPAQLGRMVADSPVLGSLNSQVRKELVEATKSAATSALTKRATGLADSLHERTLGLDDPDGPRGKKARDADADDEPDVRDDAGQDDEGDEDDGEEEERPQRRASKPARSTAGKASSGARRTASGGARKAASASRKKTASSSGGSSTRTRSAKKSGGNDE